MVVKLSYNVIKEFICFGSSLFNMVVKRNDAHGYEEASFGSSLNLFNIIENI